MQDNPIVITHALRTPIGRFLGQFNDLTAVDLGVSLLNNLLAKSGIDRGQVNQVIMGSARQAGCGPNPARQIASGAGLPDETIAMTVNQACGSGLRSIILAAQEIQLNRASIAIAGGMESMSNVPHLLPNFRKGYSNGDRLITDVMYQDGYMCPLSKKVMGVTAETLAKNYEISREDQDQLALDSQQNAQRAIKEGRFLNEIAPVQVGDKLVDSDEHPRAGVTLEKLGKLPAVFRRPGTVTAGNSSGITDGAAMVLLMRESTANELNLPILGILEDHDSAGVDPALMGIGPVPAVKKLLERMKLDNVNEFDLIELNEAFAAQVIACEKELELDRSKLNVNGGAIALGHPTGATGCRIVVTLLHEMARQDKQRGLATLCVSGGYGLAAAFLRDHRCHDGNDDGLTANL